MVEICFSSECSKCEGPFFISPNHSNRNRTMYFVHLDCWKLINRLKPNHSALRFLHKLAESTYPIFDDRDKVEWHKRIPCDVFGAVALDATQTDVGLWLGSISRLPTEIRLNVAMYYYQGLLSSLLTVYSKSTLLLKVIKPKILGGSTIDIVCSDNINSLSARLVSVCNHKYISRLGFSRTSNLGMTDQYSIPVRRSGIKGIKFVVGHHGLRAISFVYNDGSTSAWLGNEIGDWKGSILGGNFRGLRVLQDVWYIDIK
jgi:hypothetical protein